MKIKKIITSLSVLFLAVNMNAQKVENKIKEADVPAAVKTAFTQKYTGVTVKQWELDNGKYEVDFTGIDKKVQTAVFSTDGKWLITGKKLKKKDLPKTITDNIKAGEFKDWKIAQIREAETPDVAKEIIVEIEKGDDDYMLYYDATGNFLRKKKE
ncbi:MAG: PepSY-like domain-containing protein [Bacteroidia bacterium]|nr:PepSY-like domain-containing protein [Bacteroidia bacterium]